MAGALKCGQLAWITGASSGIGEALACEFADRGLRLVLSARRQQELRAVRDRLPRPEDALVLPLDMNQPSSFPDAIAQAREHGEIDWMIHNAGRSQRTTMMDTTAEAERALMETNFFGTVGLTRMLLPQMLERGQGSLVVISSVLGRFSIPRRSIYCASKHALHGYFNSIRSELADSGIEVTLICPGFVATPLAQSAEWGSLPPRPDPENDGGLTPSQCASQIAKALDRRELEAHIGGKERWGIHLAHLFPRRWAGYIRKMSRD